MYGDNIFFLDHDHMYVEIIWKEIKILDNDKILMREHHGKTGNDFGYCIATLNILESYFEKIENKCKPFITFHLG